MKQLPDEKTLLELVEMAKGFEEKARELYEMATIMAIKSEFRASARKTAKQTTYSPPS